MKVCVISDTHGNHWDVDIEPCDLFIFAGDAEITSIETCIDFIRWMRTIPSKYKIFIGGNHDTWLEQTGKDVGGKFSFFELKHKLFNEEGITYLENEGVKIRRLKIWGSPYSPFFNSWAFMEYDDILGRKIWNKIPEDANMLITHCPSYGCLDVVKKNGIHLGSLSLQNRIKELQKLKYHFFGHIHDSYGVKENKDGQIFCNCSLFNQNYKLINKPIYLEV